MMKSQAAIRYTKEPFIEDVGPRKIESIQFSTFGEAEVLKASEVEVYRGVYYDAAKKPIENGLLDPHMGPPNGNGTCETCNGSYDECLGHFGYLMLALPVYNVGFLSTIIDILKCICKFLKKMRNPRSDTLRNAADQKSIVKKCNVTGSRTVTCSNCGYINGIVKKNIKLLGIVQKSTPLTLMIIV